MTWCIKDKTEDKSDLTKDLDLVKKIFQKKIDLFLDGLNNQIDGIRLSHLSTDGSTRVMIYGMSIDISDLEDRKNKIKEYISKNTPHGECGYNSDNGGYDKIIQ